MTIIVAVFALCVAWLALVRSRQAEETTQQLRRNTDKLIQRQQQILRELHPQEYAGSQPESVAEEVETAAPAQQAQPDVEEIDRTAPAAQAEPSADRA